MEQKQRISPLGQVGILVGLFGAGALIGTLAVVMIGKFGYHLQAADLQNAMLKPQYVVFTRIAQTVSTLFTLGLPAIGFAAIMSRKPLRYVGFTDIISGKQFFIVVLIAFAGLLASDAIGTFNEWIPIPKSAATYFKTLEDNYDDAVTAIAGMKTTADYLISLVVLAFLPAMFEELFFRGAVQKIMINSTKNALLGIIITAIFFSLAHVSYYGFLPRLFLGFVLGFVFYYSKNIWLNITIHFLNNAVAITELYSLSKAGKLTPETMNETSPLYIGIFGILIVVTLLFSFKKESEHVIALYNIKHLDNERMD